MWGARFVLGAAIAALACIAASCGGDDDDVGSCHDVCQKQEMNGCTVFASQEACDALCEGYKGIEGCASAGKAYWDCQLAQPDICDLQSVGMACASEGMSFTTGCGGPPG